MPSYTPNTWTTGDVVTKTKLDRLEAGTAAAMVAADAATAGTPTGDALRAAYVPKWKANTAYVSGEPVINPSGQTVTANSSFTSGATYSASNWTVVSGGGGGGAVSSVAGRTGAVTLAAADLTDATAIGRTLLTAADAAAERTALGLGSAATQPTSAFDAAGAAAAVLPSQTGNAGKTLSTNGTTASWSTFVPTETVQTVTASTATTAISIASGSVVNLALNVNTTLSLSTPTAGQSFTLQVTNGGTNTLAFGSNVKWSGGTVPSVSSGAGKIDAFTFFSVDGVNWLGGTVGKAFA